jgi:hypothetical protein
MGKGKKINDLSFLDTEELPVVSYEDIEKELKIIELKLGNEKLKLNEQNRTERKKYAYFIFIFLCIFLFITFTIVVLTGINRLDLDKTVLITLLATTSTSIIGVFLVVVRYLFNTGQR